MGVDDIGIDDNLFDLGGTSVVAVCTGDASDDQVVDKALAVARAEGLDLIIATNRDQRSTDAARVVHLDHFGETELVQLCEQNDARLLVMPARDGAERGHLLTTLLDRLSCSVLHIAPVDRR